MRTHVVLWGLVAVLAVLVAVQVVLFVLADGETRWSMWEGARYSAAFSIQPILESSTMIGMSPGSSASTRRNCSTFIDRRPPSLRYLLALAQMFLNMERQARSGTLRAR